MRDINGASFALLLASQVMGGMALAFAAMAAGPPTAAVNQDQGGRQEGGLGTEFFEAGLEVAADESGVLWDFGGGAAGFGGFHIGSV